MTGQKIGGLARIAVYCGSAPGSDPVYADTARALGREMAARGIGLVYGGGRLGLMGIVADAVLEAGGEVDGVIPQALIDLEVAHRGLTQLHIVTDMHARKAMMTDLADAFLCLPGGIGTLDELFEAWSWNALGYHAKPLALLDVAGFWSPLIAFIENAADAGFLSPARRAQLLVSSDIGEAIDMLDKAASGAKRGMTW